MANFSKLKERRVQVGKTVPFKLYSAEMNGKTPILHLAPATEANKPYFNALLKRSGKQARAIRTNAFTADMLSENREEDRELYVQHVIRGWSDVVDNETGEQVPFSKEVCAEFLQALPDFIFDEVREFAATATNFVEQQANTEQLAGK